MDRLERFQRRAAKIILRRPLFVPSNHDELLATIGWPSLASRRKYFQAVLGYQMATSNVPQHLRDNITSKSTHMHNTRKPPFFQLPTTNTSLMLNSPLDQAADTFIVRVPGREFRFLAPLARQHLFLNLNQLILGRRIRICLLSFRQSCECCQTNGLASPVLRDRVSMATKVTCEATDTKVCSFCPHFRPFCSIAINFSNIFFCSPIIEMRILNRG